MATTLTIIDTSWRQIASAAEDFLICNTGAEGCILVQFGNTTPDSGDRSGIPVIPGDSLIRMGVSGNVYARSNNTAATASLTVG